MFGPTQNRPVSIVGARAIRSLWSLIPQIIMSHGIIYPSLLQSDYRRDTFRSEIRACVFMMIVVDGKQCVAESVHHAKASSVPDFRQKKLEAGSRFMPNASKKKLVRMCAKEKIKLAKIRLLACILRKRGRSIRNNARNWSCRIPPCATGWCGCGNWD